MESERSTEIAKYAVAYKDPVYRMGPERTRAVHSVLRNLLRRGSLLDVGTGRGELLDMALEAGFWPVQGTEVVPELISARVGYAEAHALPFPGDAFDVVCCLDVLEHLTPADTVPALSELRRIARQTVVVSAADYSAVWEGVELHVNRRPYGEWRELVRAYVGEYDAEIDTQTSRLWIVHVR